METHIVVLVLLFFETTLVLGFAINGELVLVVDGAAAAHGDGSVITLIALAWAGAVAGDLVGLQLGRAVGRRFLDRHGRRVGLGTERLARLDNFFARHGHKALFLGRFTGFFRSTMPFVVGSSGMTVRRLAPVSAASALVWTTTFAVVGYAVAEAVETVTWIAFAAVLTAAAAFMIQARLSARALPVRWT